MVAGWPAQASIAKRLRTSFFFSREMDRWRPLAGYTAITYRWSPDGHMLAGYGKRRTASSVCFFAVDPLTRSAWIGTCQRL